MTEIKIRSAVKDDLSKIFDLIKLHHGDLETKISLEDFLDSSGLVGDYSPAYFKCLIAEKISGESTLVIGYVIFYWCYSTWEGKSLEIQDFYLVQDEDTKENQSNFLKQVLVYAQKHNCARVDTHISKKDDKNRILFHNIGAINLTETEAWLLYTFDTEIL